MRRFGPIALSPKLSPALLIALFAVLAAGPALAKQASPPAPSPPATAQPDRVKVYAVGAGVTAPELLPLDLDPVPDEKCGFDFRQEGKIEFYIIVDSTGRARNIIFYRPLGSELDKLALQVVEADRFKPGTKDGQPVAVARNVEVKIEACIDVSANSAGKTAATWQLRTVPKQKLKTFPNPPEQAVFTPGTVPPKALGKTHPREDYFGGSVTAPVLTYSVEAEYTSQATKAKIAGVCVVSLVVDPHGLPEDVRVLRPLAPGLDRNAIDAVKSYRYIPAFKNDEPVPAVLTVSVRFSPPGRDLENTEFEASEP